MATVKLQISDQELELFKQYAKMKGQSLSETIRNTMLERIEDEYDLNAIKEYESEKEAGTLELYSLDEVEKELSL